MFVLERCSHLVVQADGETLYRVLGELGAQGMSWIRKWTGISRQLLEVPRKLLTLYELGVSSKQVKPIKYSRQQAPQCNSLTGPSKWETRVNLFTVPRTCFILLGIIFKVDRLGQTSSGHPSGENFFMKNIPKLLDLASVSYIRTGLISKIDLLG